MGLASGDAFAQGQEHARTRVENITTVAATAEVLATIVNTVGYERVPLDERHQAQHRGGGDRGEDPLRDPDLRRGRRQGRHEADLGPERGLRQQGELPHDAGRRRSDLHQRLPDRRHRVRPRRQAHRLALRALRRGVHGRRGRAPRARAAVAGQARQRPRVHALRRPRGGPGPADHRQRRLLRHPPGRHAARGRRLRLRQGGLEGRAVLRVRRGVQRTPDPASRRSTPASRSARRRGPRWRLRRPRPEDDKLGRESCAGAATRAASAWRCSTSTTSSASTTPAATRPATSCSRTPRRPGRPPAPDGHARPLRRGVRAAAADCDTATAERSWRAC